MVWGSEDVLPWANDGAGGGGTRNCRDNPGVGRLTPGQPSCPCVQSTPTERSLSISPWPAEVHLARPVLQCNFLTTEMTLCQAKPQTGFISRSPPPPKVHFC